MFENVTMGHVFGVIVMLFVYAFFIYMTYEGFKKSYKKKGKFSITDWIAIFLSICLFVIPFIVIFVIGFKIIVAVVICILLIGGFFWLKDKF